jgi:tyrosine-protein phosphatase YwqE
MAGYFVLKVKNVDAMPTELSTGMSVVWGTVYKVCKQFLKTCIHWIIRIVNDSNIFLHEFQKSEPKTNVPSAKFLILQAKYVP